MRGYALLWFLVNDTVKLLTYRILGPAKKTEAGPFVKGMAPMLHG